MSLHTPSAHSHMLPQWLCITTNFLVLPDNKLVNRLVDGRLLPPMLPPYTGCAGSRSVWPYCDSEGRFHTGETTDGGDGCDDVLLGVASGVCQDTV